MLDLVTWVLRVIWCVVGNSYTGYGVARVRRIESVTPCCVLSPPQLWARSPHGPLVYCCWQGARLIMCSLLQLRREGEREGSSGPAPQTCRLPRPQHSTNESKGSGWVHTGGQGLLPRAKEPEKQTWGEEARRHQQGLLQQACTPAVFLQACVKTYSLMFDDGRALFGLCVKICLEGHLVFYVHVTNA